MTLFSFLLVMNGIAITAYLVKLGQYHASESEYDISLRFLEESMRAKTMADKRQVVRASALFHRRGSCSI